MGFVSQIPLQDTREWLPARELGQSQTVAINKDKAIKLIEDRLLGASPRTRNSMLLRRGHNSALQPNDVLPSQDKRHTILQNLVSLNKCDTSPQVN